MTTLTRPRHEQRATRRPVAPDYFERFLHRTGRLLDPTALQKLRTSRLLIAGCGGVGAAVALSMARLGVGRFTLADPGIFDEPDVNRQWGADTATLGRNKAHVYRDWLRRIQPEADVAIETRGVTTDNVERLLADADLVIDCMDISVDLGLRSRLFALAAARGVHSVTAPVLGFGALIAVADPHGPSMDMVVDLIRQTVTTGRLPQFVRDFYAPASVAAIERDLCTGRVPSLSIGPVLAGALVSMEALLILLRGQAGPWRPPLCLPRVVLMDAFTAQHRVASLPELLGASESQRSTNAERAELLRAAGHNTNILPAERVAVDLMTDSWADVPERGNARLVPVEASAEQLFCSLYGFPHALAVTRGRTAEAVAASALVRPGSIVAGNALFPTARFHIESRGAALLDLSQEGGSHVDLKRLSELLAQRQERPVSCVWVEACSNAVGGAPLALTHLRAVHEMCHAADVSVVLDATRLLENVLLCAEGSGMSETELLHQFTQCADVCVLGATKDYPVQHGGFVAARSEALFGTLCDLVLAYGSALADEPKRALAAALADAPLAAARRRLDLVAELRRQLLAADVPLACPAGGHAVVVDAAALLPHLAAEQYPVQALAGALFVAAGVRAGEHYYSPRQQAEGRQWLRLAVPIERYDAADLAPVVDALAAIRGAPEQVGGLRKVAQPPGAAGHFLARWELLSAGR